MGDGGIVRCPNCGQILAIKTQDGVTIRHKGRIVFISPPAAVSIICERCKNAVDIHVDMWYN